MTLSKIVRTAVSFAVVLSVYVVYAFTVVPLVEPRSEVYVDEHPPSVTRPKGAEGRLRQYSRYFRRGAWEIEDAMVLESDSAIIFVREYKNLQDGRVELNPFTMLFLSREQRSATSAPVDSGRVLVLEAPQGALLQFDERFDLRQAKIGKLIGGDLHGPIHIHNAPPRPGAADEVDIRTRDVKLVGDKIVTPHSVDFRFGPNWGAGRDMTILLAQREADDAKAGGTNFSGVRSLELVYDVHMHMLLGGKGLMPGDATAKPAAAAQSVIAGPPGAAATPAKVEPPVEIRSQGPFKFDTVRNVATFKDQVNVVRLNAMGPSDTMRCEMLAIYFAEKAPPPVKPSSDAGGASAPPAPGASSSAADQAVAGADRAAAGADRAAAGADPKDLAKLEPRLIEARGEPVIVESPSNSGRARCQRLEYDVRNGSIHLEDSREVLLTQYANEIRCPKLDYQPGVAGRLGRLTALGPGTLRGAPKGDPLHQYQARWGKKLLMQPEGELHLVSLLGDAQMRLTDTGALSAEEIFIWISEIDRSTAPRPGAKPSETGNIQVERMLAVERVRIDSQKLTGQVKRMEVWFDRPAPAPTTPSAPEPAASPGAAVAAQPPPPPPTPQPAKRPGPPANRYDISGAVLRLKINAKNPDGEMAVSEVDVDDNARLLETKTLRPDEKPLLARGQNLHVANADTPNAHVIVSGKPGYIEARGLTLSGAMIQMEKGANRLWIDGAGRMTLPNKGQLAGPPNKPRQAPPLKTAPATMPATRSPPPSAAAARPKAAAPETPLEVIWQGAMNFDGLTASFDRSVLARAEHQSLRTEFMQVTLKQRVDFSAPPQQDENGGGSEVDVVSCRGGALIESRAFDEQGLLTSIDQMQALTLDVNQTTGAISGQGPGWVKSVRRGEEKPLDQSPQGAAAGAKNVAAGPKQAPPKDAAAAKPSPPKSDPGIRAEASPASGLGGGSQSAPQQVSAKNRKQAGAAANVDPPAAEAPPAPKLNYLSVTFERSLVGNIHRREVTFADRVRCTVGPVFDWQDQLDPDDMESVGPQGMVMHCDQLSIREMPPLVRGERGATEMEAIGSTLVEGQTFTALANRLTYTQVKDLMVLEGNPRSDAELTRQPKPGLPRTKVTARKIMYWRKDKRAEVDDARYIDLSTPDNGKPLPKDPMLKKKQ